MRILPILGGIAVAILFFFAVIFALAASSPSNNSADLLTSGILFIVGLAIIVGIYYITRKPKTVIQQLGSFGANEGSAN